MVFNNSSTPDWTTLLVGIFYNKSIVTILSWYTNACVSRCFSLKMLQMIILPAKCTKCVFIGIILCTPLLASPEAAPLVCGDFLHHAKKAFTVGIAVGWGWAGRLVIRCTDMDFFYMLDGIVVILVVTSTYNASHLFEHYSYQQSTS